MDKFLKELGIEYPGKMAGEKYIVELPDSEEYSKVYTLLDNAEGLDMDEDLTLLNENVSEFVFMSDDYDIKLIGNFEEGIYRIIVTEAEE